MAGEKSSERPCLPEIEKKRPPFTLRERPARGFSGKNFISARRVEEGTKNQRLLALASRGKRMSTKGVVDGRLRRTSPRVPLFPEMAKKLNKRMHRLLYEKITRFLWRKLESPIRDKAPLNRRILPLPAQRVKGRSRNDCLVWMEIF